MSSTNKTTYYDLSQYIGTDKPTYLGDYNSDMSKIDGAIHGVQETATTANQTAGSADAKVTQVTENVEALKGRVGVLEGNVSNLQEKDTAQDSEINSAKQKAESANTTANNALQSANTANTKVDSAKFNGWKTLTNAHSNIFVDNAKIMFNRQLNLLAFDINLTTVTGLTESDIAFRLPVDIPKPNKTVRIRSCCLDLLNDTSSGFDKIAIRDIVIDTDGYLHIAIEGNSRLYCSGVFAVDAW
jgi:hypothetical protein|nr:MAG TPA: major outer membrane lipoprotein [Caudoviricetes sp.]